jgi:hypothetical protein
MMESWKWIGGGGSISCTANRFNSTGTESIIVLGPRFVVNSVPRSMTDWNWQCFFSFSWCHNVQHWCPTLVTVKTRPLYFLIRRTKSQKMLSMSMSEMWMRHKFLSALHVVRTRLQMRHWENLNLWNSPSSSRESAWWVRYQVPVCMVLSGSFLQHASLIKMDWLLHRRR